MKNRIHRITIAVLALALAGSAALAGADGRWLHVRIEDHRGGDDQVSVNLPLSFVKSMLPMIQTDELRGGSLYLDDREFEGIELYKLAEAILDAPDAEFITVRSDDENVVVAKERGFIIIRAHERRDQVTVRFPIEVIDAMVGHGDTGRLDLTAALDALADYDHGDLVQVDSDDTSVRIWIDSDETGRGR